MTFTTRFAPSPTGWLHAGHAFSALAAHAAAREAGGRFLLRIEDIDTTRARPEFEQGIYDDLEWLGLDWERPVRRQSEHLAEYSAALEKLIGLGVMYRCFRTRREVMEAIASAPHGAGEVFTGGPLGADEEAERLAAGAPFAWRISLSRSRDVLGGDWDRLGFVEEDAGPDGETGWIAARPDLLGDAVLARKDVATSYHLACTHDDALQGITHVIRGRDLFESTHVHVLLQALLRLPTPVYRHHRLIGDAHGERLAKRTGAPSLREMRLRQDSPEILRKSLLTGP